MKCPYCPVATLTDLFDLALHMEDKHPQELSRAKVVDAVALQVVGCDIDAIYSRRPDLVRKPFGGRSLLRKAT